MLKYSELTEQQRKFIVNGCGSKGGNIPIPNFLFLASCNHHDFLYWQGFSEKDRKIADKSFYKWMKEDVKLAPWYKKLFFRTWAFIFYIAVRFRGCRYFNYGSKKKNLNDLYLEMKVYV